MSLPFSLPLPSLCACASLCSSRNILDDFREAYFWLRQNTHDQATVMSWWDYGYQIAGKIGWGRSWSSPFSPSFPPSLPSSLPPFLPLVPLSPGMGNRTTLVDNNTWNNSHIALVGKAMSSTEDKAIKIMRMLGVNYVLVIFGGMIGYSGDDINKFLWMVRIAEGEHPQDIKVPRDTYNIYHSPISPLPHRSPTTSPPRGNFALIRLVLRHCSTASCINWPTTGLVRFPITMDPQVQGRCQAAQILTIVLIHLFLCRL